MAIVKNGVNGSFSGKVGSVVGYEWRGIPVIRGLPNRKKRAPTILELTNREKMRLMQDFLKDSIHFVRIGFSLEVANKKMSAFNAAMSYNKKNAFMGDYPNLVVNHEKILLSNGNLPSPKDVEVSLQEGGVLFRWSTDGIRENTNMRTILFIKSDYRPINAMIIGGERANVGEEFLTFGNSDKKVPKGEKIHLFMAFVTVMHDAISDSVYCGALEN